MNVKGVAYIARKEEIISEFGEERWNDFNKRFEESHPIFEGGILATKWIPVEEFLAFIDEVIKEFYNGDYKMTWKLGEKSAEAGLTENGPFHVFLRSKREPKDFLSNVLPRIWNMYYDEGSVKYEFEGNIMHAYVLDMPLYHIYFEYTNMGYVEKALEITGFQVKEIIKVKSTLKEIYYKFVLDL